MNRKSRAFTLRRILVVVAVMSSFILLGAVSGGAVEINEKLSINGFIENITGVRTQDHSQAQPNPAAMGLPDVDAAGNPITPYAEKGDLAISRSTLQVEGKGRLSDTVTYSVKVRAWYESMYAFDSDIDQRPDDFDEDIKDIDFGKYVISAEFGRWNLQIGSQELVWGETDLFRMADVVNPVDFSWHFLYTNLDADGYRQPLRMAVIDYDTGWNQVAFQAVVIPEEFRPIKLAAEGANWSHPKFNELSGATLGTTGVYTYNLANILMREGADTSDFDNCEVGFRARGMFADVDMSVFYFYSRVDEPTVEFDEYAAVALMTYSGGPLPPGYTLPGLMNKAGRAFMDIKYPKYHTVGATANYFEPHLNMVFRFECAYDIDHPFTSFEFTSLPEPLRTGIGAVPTVVKQDVFNYMIGFDKEFAFSWMHGRNINVFGQMFQRFVFDSPELMFYPFMDNTDDQTMFTLIVNSFLGQGNRWQPQVVLGYDVTGGSLIWSTIKYAPSDNWSIGLNYTYLDGKYNNGQNGGYFHPYERNDEVYLQVRLKL